MPLCLKHVWTHFDVCQWWQPFVNKNECTKRAPRLVTPFETTNENLGHIRSSAGFLSALHVTIDVKDDWSILERVRNLKMVDNPVQAC